MADFDSLVTPPFLDVEAALVQLRGDATALRLLGHVYDAELPGYLLAVDKARLPEVDRLAFAGVLQRLRTTFGLFKCMAGQVTCVDLQFCLSQPGSLPQGLLDQLEAVLAGLAVELAVYCGKTEV